MKPEERSVEAVVIGEPRHEADSPGGQLGGNPMWSKAPLVLRRFPAILVAIVASAVILAVSSAAGPLFLSSAGSASLANGIARTTPFSAGLSVVVYGPVERDALATRTRLLSERVSEVRGLGKPVATVIGSVGPMMSQQPLGSGLGFPSVVGTQVRLVSRTGALDHVERLRSVPGDGVWVSSQTASVLDLEMGDVVSLSIREAFIETKVVGVYRTLQYDANFPQDHAEFWNPLSTFIGKNAPTGSLPPLFVLGSEETIVELLEKLHDSGQYRWDVPLTRRHMGLEEGRATASGISGIQADLDDGQGLGGSFPFSTTSSSLPGIVATSEESVDSVRGPVFTISLAGRLVALAVVGAVGTFALGRRRTEFVMLAARGVGRLAIGARAGVEALIPIGLGTMAGVALAMFIVRRIGPSDLIDGASVTSAYGTAGITALFGAALLAGVSAAALRESDAAGSRLRESVQRAPWIGLAVGLAGASLYEIFTRGEEGTTERVDVLLLLFPLLFIASGAGLATRWLMRLLPKLRTLRSQRSPALFLASRRLAAASRTALVLVTACAVALGIFLYAGVLVASLRATSEAKSFVFTGSDVAVVLPANPALPQLPFPSTQVARVTSARVRPGGKAVEILAIDPETFPTAAFWDPSFSEAPLREVLRSLRPGDELPIVVAGRQRPVEGLDLEGFRIPVRRTGAVRAFPGMQGEGPVLVTSRDALVSALEDAGGTLSRFDRVEELWARGSAEQVLGDMRRAGVPIQRQVTAEEVRSTPSFLSLSWTYDLLQALGVLSGILALVGIVLYLQTRQRSREVAYAIARRMGLTSRSHRRSIALELGGMMVVAFLIAAVLAIAAAVLVNPRLDPLSGVPPAPVLRLPLALVWLSLGALLAATWIGAWRVGRRADRARVAEVMRLGG